MTLSSVKKQITVGTKLKVIDHWLPKYIGSEREVSKTQGNGYYFDFDGKRNWSPWDKASSYTFPAENRYRFQPGDKFWELEVIA